MGAIRWCELLLAVTMAGLSQAAPITFPDASFESPVATGFQSATATVGSWQLTNGSATVTATGSTHTAQSGSQFLFVPGTTSQTTDIGIALSGFVPGIEYQCTYWLCGRNTTAAPRQCAIEIALFNSKQQSFDLAVPASETNIGSESNEWVRRTFTFVAPSPSTDLNINVYRSDSTNDAFAAFDNFSIDVVPKGRPVVRVKSPRRSPSDSTRARVVLRGSASSTLPLETVTIRAGKKTITAPAAASWKKRVSLRPGTNRFRITATDIAGTQSTAVTRVIRRVD